jgi:hypothetical protein
MKWLSLAFAVMFTAGAWSQNEVVLFNGLVANDSSSLPCLFSHPDSIRNAFLIASTFPSGLLRANEIQQLTNASLKILLSPFNTDRQKQFWELCRYPGLLNILAESKSKQEKNLEVRLRRYPETVKNQALLLFRQDYNILLDMDRIHQNFDMQVEALTGNFPDELKQAFLFLIRFPEVMTGLTANIKTTTVLGDLYRKNPVLLNHLSDSLCLELAAEKEMEYEDWKNGILADTSLQRELKQLAGIYAGEADNRNDTVDKPNADFAIKSVRDRTPYPYWAGYPGWMGNDNWVPFPWWYQMGLFWTTEGKCVLFSLPTYQFGWWYFNHSSYNDNYPRVSHYFDIQLETHKNYYSGFNKSINEFRGGPR